MRSRVQCRLLLLTAFFALTACGEEITYGGGVRAYFESAYVSSSGGLNYTRPVAEQYADFFVRIGDFGRISTDMWVASDLAGQKQDVHQRAFYCWEGTLMYGYDFAFDDDRRYVLDSSAGILWDWLLGYRSHCDIPIFWYYRQAFENPWVTPYWNGLGLFEGGERNCRFLTGVRHGFRPVDDVTLSPFFEAVFGDRVRFEKIYGGEPDDRIPGGSLMSVRPGMLLKWNFLSSWYLWGRYRHYIVVDPEARSLARARGNVNDKMHYPIFGLGVGVRF